MSLRVLSLGTDVFFKIAISIADPTLDRQKQKLFSIKPAAITSVFLGLRKHLLTEFGFRPVESPTG